MKRFDLKLITATFIPAFLLVFTPVGGFTLINILTNGFSLIDTMFHELGHTVFSWAFGYPALPSFDLEHGGGVSYYFDRQWLLQILAFVAAGYGCFWLYDDFDRRPCIIAAFATGLYILIAITGFHHVIIDFMGHGGAILTGSFFILRSLTGWTEKRPGEKWISAFLGYFIIFSNTKLSWKLILDVIYREDYWNQKGSHGFGDFSKIADYFWFASEKPVAWFCLGLCLIFLVLPHLIYSKNLQHQPEPSR